MKKTLCDELIRWELSSVLHAPNIWSMTCKTFAKLQSHWRCYLHQEIGRDSYLLLRKICKEWVLTTTLTLREHWPNGAFLLKVQNCKSKSGIITSNQTNGPWHLQPLAAQDGKWEPGLVDDQTITQFDLGRNRGRLCEAELEEMRSLRIQHSGGRKVQNGGRWGTSNFLWCVILSSLCQYNPSIISLPEYNPISLSLSLSSHYHLTIISLSSHVTARI